jgi:hypothetical protein
VLDSSRPEVPPDFIFPPGEEATFRLSTLKSLANWRCVHAPSSLPSRRDLTASVVLRYRPTESRTCLLECVVELFTLYKVLAPSRLSRLSSLSSHHMCVT